MVENFVPAISAIGGAVVVFLFDLIKDRVQRRANSEENFFYDVYNRRIALYEDVMKELQSMQAPDLDGLKNITGLEVSKMIVGYLQTVNTLIARLRFFGNADSRELLNKLCGQMAQLQDKALENPMAAGGVIVISLIETIEDTLNSFIDITTETGSEVIDKKISGYLKKIGCDRAIIRNTAHGKGAEG